MNFVDRNLAFSRRSHSAITIAQHEDFVVSPVDEVRKLWQEALKTAAEVTEASVSLDAVPHFDYDIVFEIKTQAWLANIARNFALDTIKKPVRKAAQLHLPIDSDFTPSNPNQP